MPANFFDAIRAGKLFYFRDFWAVYKTGMGTRGRGNWDAFVGT